MVEAYARDIVATSILPALRPAFAIAGVTRPTIINGTMNFTSSANEPPNEFKTRMAPHGAKEPKTAPAAIATSNLAR